MSKLQPVRGTHDLLPEEFAKFLAIQNAAREITAKYGFREMATPIFEFTDVFARTMGETSDVVTKEMYTFKDRGEESITLRPEFTAGIVRSFISNGLQRELPLKLFSTGPVFRYERPQKGRQRQFHQINVEWLGAQGAASDAEVILMAAELLAKLGIKAELQINSLGCKQSRENYRAKLVEYFSKYQSELSEDSKTRLEKNPLRILDSKDENDKKISHDAPTLWDNLSCQSRKNFEEIQDMLSTNLKSHLFPANDTWNLLSMNLKSNLLSSNDTWDFLSENESSSIINYKPIINHKLVRGLDYYNDVVFEFVSGDLGAQNTVLAGGRYDGLVSQMGGVETPAVGWGAGLERLMLISNIEAAKPQPSAVIAGNDSLKPQALKIAQALRAKGKVIELVRQTNIGKALTYANKIGAVEAYILGEDEAKRGVVQFKNLVSGEQSELNIDNI